MSDKEEARVVVMRCADLAQPTIATDTRPCATCGQTCWASKTTTALEDKYQVTYTCQVCTPMKEVLERGQAGVLASQRAELEGLFGKWRIALALDKLGITEVDDS